MTPPTELSTVERGELATVRPSQRSDLANLLEAAKGGLPAETIKTLVELCHAESDRRARQELNEAFAEFQCDCPMVPRTKVIDYQTKAGGKVHYAYSPLPVILTTIQPYLDANNLSRSWSSDDASKPGTMIVTCRIRHISGAYHESTAQGPIELDAKMGPLKSTNATRTVLMRASLIGALGLVNCDEDTDGNGPAAGDDVGLADAQVETLNNLCIEAKRKPETFAKAYGATKLSEIPAAMFEPACNVLNIAIRATARNP